MKTKTSKRPIIVVTIVLSIILLLPIPLFYKDGGTVEYRAILYSVEKAHSISLEGSGYDIGTRVRILFWEVYDDVEFVPNEP